MRSLALGTVSVSATTTLIALMLIAAVPVEMVPVGYRIPEMLPFVALQVAFTVVGAVLVLRRPENRVGQLLCGTALVSSVLILTSGVAVHALASGDLAMAATAAWIASWSTLGLGVTFGPVLLIFPDGRIRSAPGRAAMLTLLITVVLVAVAVALRPGPLSSFPSIANPYAWIEHGPLLDAALALGMVAGLAATLLGLGSQIARFRASQGVERQQLKWILASAVLVALALGPAMALLYGEAQPGAAPLQRYLGRAIGALSTTAMPIAMGIAILRYRLYDIDLLIRRTLVYAGVSALLVAAYIAAVVLTGAALRPFTAGSDLAVAASTLVVVALFQPVRQRVRDLVDRRFYRSRYDAARTLDAFSARLRDQVELNAVQAELVGVIHDTIRPAHASLWLRR